MNKPCEACPYECDDGVIRDFTCNECPLIMELKEEDKMLQRRKRIEEQEKKVDREDPF